MNLTNANKPANPIGVGNKYTVEDTGLTKVETIAMHLYTGMLSACDSEGELTAMHADLAVTEAYNLLQALEKAKEG